MQDYKIIILLLFISLSTFGQTDKKMDYTWTLGYETGLIDSAFGGSNLNFDKRINQIRSFGKFEIIYHKKL